MDTVIVGLAVGAAGLWTLYRVGGAVRGLRRASAGAASPRGGCGGCGGCGGSDRGCSSGGHALLLATTAFLGIALAPVAAARAADTIETWGVGASDVELYLGADGLGGDERAVFGDFVLGYGLVDGFSAFFGISMSGDAALGQAAEELAFGAFGTPLDTDHVDLDLLLELRRADRLQVTPSLELNLDAAPDLAAWGAYVRAGVPVYARPTSPEPTEGSERTAHLEINPGLYWTAATGHQLFVEYDMALHPDASASLDERTSEIGGVAVGYNVVLSDALEFIGQGYWDIPQARERSAVGVSVGFVATLPAGDSGRAGRP